MEWQEQQKTKCVDTELMWQGTIWLLGLDSAQVFSQELGLTPFLSDQLQAIARDLVGDALWADVAPYKDIMRRIQVFVSKVESCFGNGVLEAIRSWQRYAFPGHDRLSQYRIWRQLLTHLSQIWDEEDIRQDAPLTAVRLAPIRLLIRDYLAHLRCLYLELEQAQEQILSRDNAEWEWDRRVLLRLAEWFGLPEDMGSIASNLRSTELWDSLAATLSESDCEALVKWAQRDHVVLQGLHISSVPIPRSPEA